MWQPKLGEKADLEKQNLKHPGKISPPTPAGPRPPLTTAGGGGGGGGGVAATNS